MAAAKLAPHAWLIPSPSIRLTLSEGYRPSAPCTDDLAQSLPVPALLRSRSGHLATQRNRHAGRLRCLRSYTTYTNSGARDRRSVAWSPTGGLLAFVSQPTAGTLVRLQHNGCAGWICDETLRFGAPKDASTCPQLCWAPASTHYPDTYSLLAVTPSLLQITFCDASHCRPWNKLPRSATGSFIPGNVAWSPAGTYLLAWQTDGLAAFGNVPPQVESLNFMLPEAAAPAPLLQGAYLGAFSPDECHLAAVRTTPTGREQLLRLIAPRRPQGVFRTITEYDLPIGWKGERLRFSESAQGALALVLRQIGGTARALLRWDSAECAPLFEQRVPSTEQLKAAPLDALDSDPVPGGATRVPPHGEHILVRRTDSSLALVSLADKRCVSLQATHPDEAQSRAVCAQQAAWSPCGTHLATQMPQAADDWVEEELLFNAMPRDVPRQTLEVLTFLPQE